MKNMRNRTKTKKKKTQIKKKWLSWSVDYSLNYDIFIFEQYPSKTQRVIFEVANYTHKKKLGCTTALKLYR